TCIGSIARRLSLCAPQFLWLLIALQRDSAAVVIATWRCVGSVPRICAMITERGNIVDSDAETLCALVAASQAGDEVMRHMRWMDILGRDAVTQRFFAALSRAVDSLAGSIPTAVPSADRREIAILATSRLLFLSFLETKGWLNEDHGFLANGFAECMASGGQYQRRVLEPLFFGTLNTRVHERAPRARAFGRVPFLNGGLFARTAVERIHRHSRFSDDAMGVLFGDVLVRYRFTAREDGANWSQTAIDPEMLGRVFESLMESHDRKRGGVYYTPQHFVERLTLLTLAHSLTQHGFSPERATRLLASDPNEICADPVALAQLRSLRVLDPACGSGAFLVHALERVAQLRIAVGDDGSLSDIRRSVLTRSIFGVDSSATAVWLCELRLWLSAVIDSTESDPMRVIPLPNLDRQIRVGDSLSGPAFVHSGSSQPVSRQLSALHDRYVRATGRRKVGLSRRLDIVERERAIAVIDRAIARATFERREIVRAVRTKDLFGGRRRPNATGRLCGVLKPGLKSCPGPMPLTITISNTASPASSFWNSG
ncbi:MAG: N-6 DNA methylase, partial [Gemmatimonadales bacterium]